MKRPEILEEDEEPANYEPLSDAEFEALSLTSPPPVPGPGERAFGTLILVLLLAGVGIAVAWVVVRFPGRAYHPEYWWWAIPTTLVAAFVLRLAIQFREKIDQPGRPLQPMNSDEAGAPRPSRPHPLDAIAWFFLAWYAGAAVWIDTHLAFRVIAGLTAAFFAHKAYVVVEELRERHTWAPLDRRRTAKDALMMTVPVLLHMRWVAVEALVPVAKVILPATLLFAVWLRRALDDGPPSLP